MNFFEATLGRGSRKPLLIIINGESNSGGYAPNSEAPSGEKGTQPSVSLLNPVSLVFEPLVIGGAGSNNLLDHAGLSNGSEHGFELELAKRSLSDTDFYTGVRLVKTGQGGSQISQWNVGGGYMNKFVQRINAAKTFINFSEYNVAILFSLGINDGLSETNVDTWKVAVANHFSAMRSAIGQGNVPIVMTEFQGMGSGGNYFANYTTAIRELAATIPNVRSIDASGAALRDVHHWNYTGMKLVSGRLLDQVKNIYG